MMVRFAGGPGDPTHLGDASKLSVDVLNMHTPEYFPNWPVLSKQASKASKQAAGYWSTGTAAGLGLLGAASSESTAGSGRLRACSRSCGS